MNRGSVWRKWDLHVHTPASFHHQFRFLNGEEKEKYQDNIWEKYISKIRDGSIFIFQILVTMKNSFLIVIFIQDEEKIFCNKKWVTINAKSIPFHKWNYSYDKKNM